MSEGQPDLGSILDKAMAEVQATIERQRQVVRLIARNAADGAALRAACPLLDCSRLEKLRAAIVDAVEVLEQTRRSFKSRQLEALRKRLNEVLMQ